MHISEKLAISTIIIEPVGGDCNLACDYCYHGNIRKHDGLQTMTDDILEKIVKEALLINKNRVKFLWHGGEPFLTGLGFYEKVVKFQKRYLVSSDQQLINHIQTNATLINDDWVEFIKENDFKVSTSIDGPAWLHDKCRHDIHGNGSFDRTIRGINLLRNAGLTVGVMVTINQYNVRYPELIYRTLLDLDIKNFEINPVSAIANDPSLPSKPADMIKFLEKVFDLWFDADDPSVYIRIFHNVIRSLVGASTNDCSFSYNRCREYVAIDEKGEVYSCGRFLKEESAYIGSCVDNSLVDMLKVEKTQQLYDLISKIRPECFDCRWLSACGGGCAYQRWMNGGFGSLFPQCEVRKALFEHIEIKTKNFL